MNRLFILFFCLLNISVILCLYGDIKTSQKINIEWKIEKDIFFQEHAKNCILEEKFIFDGIEKLAFRFCLKQSNDRYVISLLTDYTCDSVKLEHAFIYAKYKIYDLIDPNIHQESIKNDFKTFPFRSNAFFLAGDHGIFVNGSTMVHCMIVLKPQVKSSDNTNEENHFDLYMGNSCNRLPEYRPMLVEYGSTGELPNFNIGTAMEVLRGIRFDRLSASQKEELRTLSIGYLMKHLTPEILLYLLSNLPNYLTIADLSDEVTDLLKSQCKVGGK